MSTLREIYDRTVAHMRSMPGPCAVHTPGAPALDHMVCKYRGEGGSRCAVGLWIPDELYTPEMEDVSLSALRNPTATVEQRAKIRLIMKALPPLPPRGLDLLIALQKVHDQVAHRKGIWDEEVFEEDLTAIREEFKL